MKKLILIFILLISFTTVSYSQWFQLPNLPVSGTIYDMWFVNPNTGWITTSNPSNTLRTTDAGQNWIVQLSGNSIRGGVIQFFDSNTGVSLGTNASFNAIIIKTSNSGSNWITIYTTSIGFSDLFFISKDTGWVCGFDGIFGGVWRTTDGGYNWARQYTSNSNGLDKIFFLNEKVNGEYWGWTYKVDILYRTTNSGVNWTLINNSIGGGCGYSADMIFFDTANGIITRNLSCFSLTTNGGYNFNHYSEYYSADSKIGIGDKNKIWLTLQTDSILKTNNYFQSYGKQFIYSLQRSVFALDTSIVYAGRNATNMMKTTNGGGPIIYTGMDNTNKTIPDNFILFQNFPNPFNPQTTIKFSVFKSSYISLIIYDLTSKEVVKVYENEYLPAGNYKADLNFEKLSLSSGVYFYQLTVTDNLSKILFKESKKLVYTK